VPGAGCQVPGAKCQVPGAKCRVYRTEHQLTVVQTTLVPVPVAVFKDCAMTGPTKCGRAIVTVPKVPTSDK
jgi:hypothetical protein